MSPYLTRPLRSLESVLSAATAKAIAELRRTIKATAAAHRDSASDWQSSWSPEFDRPTQRIARK